jgi:phosphopantothenoylcysteine decarboxylase/phosphopantothenate--cysteine ligase
MARTSPVQNGGGAPQGALAGRIIVLGVTGSIAAYKAIELLRLLTKDGADVHVILTRNALQFVTPLTFQVLSGHRVTTSTWDEPEPEAARRQDAVEETTWSPVGHIDLATRADLVVIAPATANVIGKYAHGIADDALSTLLLAARCPVLIAPAMNDAMYAHAAVAANMRVLGERGASFVDPESGDLACRTVGTGRLADPALIHAAIRARLARSESLRGRTVLVTAGRTEEAIDPVRVITNRSSGKMGVALARAARERGARVILVAGAMSVDPPGGVDVRRVTSAAEMAAAVRGAARTADVVVMAAAVSDYTPASSSPRKLERAKALTLALTPTEDILAAVGREKSERVIVGFALETGSEADDLARAREKMKRKQCDLMVLNNVLAHGAAIGGDTNVVTLIARDGTPERLACLPKSAVAEEILNRVEGLLSPPRARARTRS